MNKIAESIIDNIKFIIIGLLIIAGIFLFTQWKTARNDHTQLENLLNDTIHHYETVITDQGTELNRQIQTVASLENAITAGLIDQEKLKNANLKLVNHVIELENEIVFLKELVAKVDSPSIIYVDSATVDSIDEGTYLRVPANFVYADDWVSFAGTIYGATVGLRGLTIRQEPTIFLGYQKAGFFKPLVPVVTVEDSNPYVHTVAMRNVKITKKPPFYSRPWFHFLGGAATMVAVQVTLNQLR